MVNYRGKCHVCIHLNSGICACVVMCPCVERKDLSLARETIGKLISRHSIYRSVILVVHGINLR